MAVWLLALAYQAEAGSNGVSLPRRLVWVVNRRVVVDQATNEAERLKQHLKEGGPPQLESVRGALRKLSATNADNVVVVSTLRGQFADNAEWRSDPARPAVVVGTVDMVGSRLLFAGYGRGYKSRPLHAGFLGQDALLVHDEAHLEPAFQELVVAVESEQQRCHDFRRLRVMALSATSRGGNEQVALTEADRKHAEIRKRIEAKKGIAFYPVEDEKKLAGEICRRALEFKDSGQAILIFLRKLKDVHDVVADLRKEHLAVRQLTGTLRGYERDEMVRADTIFARFMPDSTLVPKYGTVYLVCTSAGEVGINMSGEHLVCDLTPFDSMAQRLGRVNRFGEGDAQVEIVHCTASGDQTSRKKPKDQRQFEEACDRTFALLQKLPKLADGRYDGSPVGLGSLKARDRQAAFTPEPMILSTSDILFDKWAFTSIRELPGRPPVADWLHGVAVWEPPQTYVAWRQEVEIITPNLQETYRPEDLLEDFPLKPHELLRAATDRVAEHLEKIAKRHPELSLWRVESDGSVHVLKLAELALGGDRKRPEWEFANCTVLLSPAAGGLKEGMLSGEAEFDDTSGDLYDLADKWTDEKNVRRRSRLWDDEEAPSGMRLVRTVDIHLDTDDDVAEEVPTRTRRYWRWYVRPRSADDDGSRTARQAQDLDRHNQAARDYAFKLASRLKLPELEASAIVLAAGWHDMGKGRELWQRSIGNRNFPQRVLAKSDRKVPPVTPSGYRHEFGSLIEASCLPEFLRLKREAQDLVLHLIAAHHGRARPFFPSDEAFDPEYMEQISGAVASEVPRRFARLQRKYGRWGLAYLESLVRAADAQASQSLELAETVGLAKKPIQEAGA